MNRRAIHRWAARLLGSLPREFRPPRRTYRDTEEILGEVGNAFQKVLSYAQRIEAQQREELMAGLDESVRKTLRDAQETLDRRGRALMELGKLVREGDMTRAQEYVQERGL